MLLIAFAGQTVLYACGMPWLAAYVGIDKAIALGLMPFIISGLVKSVLVASIVGHVKK